MMGDSLMNRKKRGASFGENQRRASPSLLSPA